MFEDMTLTREGIANRDFFRQKIFGLEICGGMF
jgi:hypothetical protein